MEILKVEIENFGPFEAATIHLDSRGLVNVEGENRDDPSADSNGSGKSSLPDALEWCLFAETAREVTGDDVIARFAGKNCSVKTTIKEGDDLFVVDRWRKKRGYKGKTSGVTLEMIDASGTVTDLSKGTDKLTQVEIEKVLGCSKDVFTKAVYSGQEALPDLPKMTDKEIKTLVEEAAGIEILTTAYELARKHQLECDRANSEAIRVVSDEERRFLEAEARLKDVTLRRDGWKAEQDKKVAGETLDMSRVVTGARTLKAEIDGIDVAGHNTAASTLRASVDAVSGEQAELRKRSDTLSSAKSRAASALATLNAKLSEVRRAKTHNESVSGRVGTPCGECGKTYEAADIAGAQELAADKLRQVTSEALTLKTAHDEAQAAVDAALVSYHDYQASMTDVSETVAKIGQHEEVLRRHERLTRDLATGVTEAKRIKVEIDALATQTNPFIDMVTEAEQKRDEWASSLVASRTDLEEKQKALKIAQGAVSCFGPSGVRAYVLDTVTPFLNSRTAHYLGTLSDGRIEAIWTTLSMNAKGELTEKFSIAVEKQGGGASFKALSGGEKRKVRLACALALQDLVGSRASKPINLCILDEVDDALDDAGLERLMSVLTEKAREKGTLLVISHNSLSDYITETLTVTMEGGKSTVSGCLC